MAIDGRDWGANWEEALQDCDCRARSTSAVDKIGRSGKDWQRACGLRVFPVAKGKQEDCMAKIDIDSLSIEELAALRDRAIEKLAEKVAARQAELEAEMERLSQYGKSSKKVPASAPVAKKPKKSDEKKNDLVTEPIAEAA
jgi:hypothetical protein